MNYRTFFVLSAMAASSTAVAGGVIVMAGAGIEEIKNSSVAGELAQVGALYRFDNGILAGGMVETIDMNKPYISDEVRTNAIIGYGTKVGDARVSVQAAYMLRDFELSTKTDMGVVWVRPAVTIPLTDNLYGEVSYRYRTKVDGSVPYKTDTYAATVGYNINKQYAVQAQYSTTYGTYKSDAYSMALVAKF